MVNLYDMVGADLNHLATTVTECLEDPRALRVARQIVDGTPDAAVFDNLDLTDRILRYKVAILALGADCLNRVIQAILADGIVEQEELDVAYTLVGPLANGFAKLLNNYKRYANLRSDETAEFLREFTQDRGMFGGHAERSIAYLGATLCCITSILLQTPEPFELYENMIEDVLVGVMDGQGGDEIKRVERRVVRQVRDYHKTMRATIDTYFLGNGQPSTQPARPT